jgi:RNA polymerase sigma-70 factor, ECF subfamily
MTRELVERAQAGDRDAYEALARSSAKRLFVLAVRLLRDADAAEDVVQQTLVSIWRDLPTLRDPERYEAWTYRMVVRRCATEGRRRRSTVEVADISDTIVQPGDAIGDIALHDQLGRAFAQLNQEARAIVVLHHLLGVSNVEIAAILGIPDGTVRSRLHQALRVMRASIEADARTPIHEGQPA